jgi:hypothetical protein
MIRYLCGLILKDDICSLTLSDAVAGNAASGCANRSPPMCIMMFWTNPDSSFGVHSIIEVMASSMIPLLLSSPD